MKQHLSVWMLLARSTVWKLLALCGVLIGADVLVFRAAAVGPLEEVLAGCRVPLSPFGGLETLFGLALAGAAVILRLTAWEQTAGRTLCRLRISGRAVYLWHFAHAALCYLLLWMVQALTLFLLLAGYARGLEPHQAGPQSLMLAAWRSGFLHALFPLVDGALLLRNGAILLALAAMTARRPQEDARPGRFPVGLVAWAAIAAFVWPASRQLFVTGILVQMVLAAAVLVWALWAALQEVDQDEE